MILGPDHRRSGQVTGITTLGSGGNLECVIIKKKFKLGYVLQ